MSDEYDYSSEIESEISLCTDLLQPSLEASLTSSGYMADDDDSNNTEQEEGDGEVTSAYNPQQESAEPEESVGEPDADDEGLDLLARGDAGSSTNDPPAAPVPPAAPGSPAGPARNLRRSRVYVEEESEKRARLEAHDSSASS